MTDLAYKDHGRGGQLQAEAFVAARRSARALPAYPGTPPHDLAAAYLIQDAAIGFDGRLIAGWKVGKINAPLDVHLGSNRLAGPVFADCVIVAGPGEVPAMPVYEGGFAAGESELMLHVAPGWNGTLPEDDSATMALLDAVHIGIEIASSPYPGINADGPAVTVSDFGNNMGIVIGCPVPDWRERDLCAIQARTEIDGECVGADCAANMLDGPYGAVRFLLSNLAARGLDVSGGIWVSTGAITGVHPVRPGQTVRAVFDGVGSVECRVEAARGA